MRYYLGPWLWVEQKGIAHFTAPQGARGCIDFGTLAEMATRGADRPGCLLVTDAVLPSEYVLLGDGHASEIKVDGRLRSVFASELKHGAQGDTLADLIRDSLQSGDIDGGTKWKPLMPGVRGWMDVYLGGRIQSDKFEYGKPTSRGVNMTPTIQAMLRKEFRQNFEYAQAGKLKDAEHYRRVLDFQCEKYGLNGKDDWKLLVPQDLQREVPGRLKHETTITESFNTADSGTLGPDLTWAEVAGTWAIVSNAATVTGASSVDSAARAESDLSSADHYGQTVVTSNSTGFDQVGACARFDASADSAYHAMGYQANDNLYLRKRVGGSNTTLNNLGITYGTGACTFKCEANGSTIKGYLDGVEQNSVTDTSITGNLRAGLFAYSGSVAPSFDSFEAADLGGGGGPGILYTQRESAVLRGVERGTFTRWAN